MSSFNSTDPSLFCEGVYPVESQISSSHIFFIIDKQRNRLCVKMWEPRVTDWSPVETPSTRLEYLIEGFAFNRRHAPGVYLGVAPIELIKDNETADKVKAIRLGSLLPNPQKQELDEQQKYALIMRRLDEKWQLNRRLADDLDNQDGMIFLAHEICNMHTRLSLDAQQLELLKKIGGLGTLEWKLSVNKSVFEKALLSLLTSSEEEMRLHYTRIGQDIEQAFNAYQGLFAQRRADGHIKRCHGDLKTTNLWIRPAEDSTLGPPLPQPQLLALDCIDFEPSFCYIDTLSDIAMLVVDIESCLRSLQREEHAPKIREQVQTFLNNYIAYTQESSPYVWPLLKYYMTEKAMVCTYVNTNVHNNKDAGERFLAIASAHARTLYSPI